MLPLQGRGAVIYGDELHPFRNQLCENWFL
jgi:hypothetical protein